MTQAADTFRFHCQSCQVMLQATAKLAGRSIKCPKCGAAVKVPTPPSQSPAPKPTTAADDSPSDDESVRPSVLNLDHLVRECMRIYRDNSMRLVTIWLLATVGQLAALLVGSMLGWLVSFANMPLLTNLTNGLSQAAVSLFVWISTSILLLSVARGREISLRQFFTGGPYFFRTMIASLLYWGLVLLILSGLSYTAIRFAPQMIGPPFAYLVVVGVSILIATIIALVLGLMFGQYHWLIIDHEMGPLRALTTSRQITAGNKWYLLVLVLAAICIAAIGPLAIWWTMHSLSATMQTTALLLYLYLLAVTVAPFFFLLWCVAYLQMSGVKSDAMPSTAPATVGWWPSTGLVAGGVVTVGVLVALVPWGMGFLATRLVDDDLSETIVENGNIDLSKPTTAMSQASQPNSTKSQAPQPNSSKSQANTPAPLSNLDTRSIQFFQKQLDDVAVKLADEPGSAIIASGPTRKDFPAGSPWWWLDRALEEIPNLDGKWELGRIPDRTRAIRLIRSTIEQTNASKATAPFPSEPHVRLAAEIRAGREKLFESELSNDSDRMTKSDWDQLRTSLAENDFQLASRLVSKASSEKGPLETIPDAVDAHAYPTFIAAAQLHVKELVDAGKHAEARDVASLVTDKQPELPVINRQRIVRESLSLYLTRLQISNGEFEEALTTATSSNLSLVIGSMRDFIDASRFTEAERLVDSIEDDHWQTKAQFLLAIANAQAAANLTEAGKRNADSAQLIMTRGDWPTPNSKLISFRRLAETYFELGAMNEANAVFDSIVEAWPKGWRVNSPIWMDTVTTQARLNRVDSGIPLPELTDSRREVIRFVVVNCLVAVEEADRGETQLAIKRLDETRSVIQANGPRRSYLQRLIASTQAEIGDSVGLRRWVNQLGTPRDRFNAYLGAAVGSFASEGTFSQHTVKHNMLRSDAF